MRTTIRATVTAMAAGALWAAAAAPAIAQTVQAHEASLAFAHLAVRGDGNLYGTDAVAAAIHDRYDNTAEGDHLHASFDFQRGIALWIGGVHSSEYRCGRYTTITFRTRPGSDWYGADDPGTLVSGRVAVRCYSTVKPARTGGYTVEYGDCVEATYVGSTDDGLRRVYRFSDSGHPLVPLLGFEPATPACEADVYRHPDKSTASEYLGRFEAPLGFDASETGVVRSS